MQRTQSTPLSGSFWSEHFVVEERTPAPMGLTFLVLEPSEPFLCSLLKCVHVIKQVVLEFKILVGAHRSSHSTVGSIELQHAHKRSHIRVGRRRINNQIKLSGQIVVHLIGVAQASVEIIRSNGQALLVLPFGSRQGRHMSTKRLGKLNGSCAQSTNGQDQHLLFAHNDAVERGVRAISCVGQWLEEKC